MCKIEKCVLFIVLFLISISTTSVYAQENKTEEKYGMVWYLDKTAVFDSARAQGKQIFALWGREDCPKCNATKEALSKDSIKPIIEAHFLLWHIDYGDDNDINNKKCTRKKYCSGDSYETCDEIVGYFDLLCDDTTFTFLPAVCIINPSDTLPVAHSLSHGQQQQSDLYDMLNQNVANEPVESVKIVGKAYVYGDVLAVESAVYDELISVYSIAGTLIDRFRKTDTFFTRDVSGYPSGLLIVSGCSGWNQKVFKK